MSPPRTFVVGDLHGCADELASLLDHLAPGDADTVVFLGDYIDRGPSARAVVDRVVDERDVVRPARRDRDGWARTGRDLGRGTDGSGHGQGPFSIGARTAFPHSVQLPS